MKQRSWFSIALTLLIGLCLLAVVAVTLVVIRVRNEPPSSAIDASGYYVRGSKVYYLGGFPSTAVEIADADAGSFNIIDETFASDAQHVYFSGAQIPNAEPSSFKVLQGTFSADAKHVYVGSDVFSDDPGHFEFLAGSLMRDSQHLYWDVKTVSDDAANLTVLSSTDPIFFRDSRSVFVQGNPISGADAASFAVISAAYGRDRTNIYYFDKFIAGADAASFAIIESPYARDVRHVYWMEKMIPGADPATFRILSLNFECTSDKAHAYYQNSMIASADPRSFPANGTVANCDTNGVYFSQ